MPKPFDIVVAIDKNRGIGKGNGLPWSLPGDMAYFKSLTTSALEEMRNAVIMGRKTWESIPVKFRPLKGRLNIVITSSANSALTSSVLVASSLKDALELANQAEIDRCFVIGGGQVFSEAIQMSELQQLYVTEIAQDFNCDVFFPEFANDFRLKSQSPPRADNSIEYHFKVYERIAKDGGRGSKRTGPLSLGMSLLLALFLLGAGATASFAQTKSAPKESKQCKSANKSKEPNEKNTASRGKGDRQKGAILFESLNCAACHPAGGNAQNPDLPLKGESFSKRYKDDAALEAFIRQGSMEKGMPGFGSDQLNRNQMLDLIAFIRSLSTNTK